MKDMNKVFLLGRLGVDPEIRTTQSGLTFARFSLATARRVKESSGSESGEPQWKDQTQWHRVIAWGKLAEMAQRMAKKGQTILVEGSLRQRKYEAKDGRSQISFEVHADEMSFLNTSLAQGRAANGSELENAGARGLAVDYETSYATESITDDMSL
jgi:single-strand DNA-binding protein